MFNFDALSNRYIDINIFSFLLQARVTLRYVHIRVLLLLSVMNLFTVGTKNKQKFIFILRRIFLFLVFIIIIRQNPEVTARSTFLTDAGYK